MFHRTGPSRSDNRYRKLPGKRSKCFIGISGLHTIMIHAGKKYLSGTPFLSLFGPCQQFFICLYTAAIQVTFPTIFSHFGIYGKHANLRTEVPCYIINQLRITNGRRVYRYFIGTGIQQTIHITQFIDPSSHCKRDINISSNSFHQFGKGLTPFMTGGNIKKSQLISSLFAISTSQFNRITCLTEVDKIGSFYSLPIFYIKTGNNSFC